MIDIVRTFSSAGEIIECGGVRVMPEQRLFWAPRWTTATWFYSRVKEIFCELYMMDEQWPLRAEGTPEEGNVQIGIAAPWRFHETSFVPDGVEPSIWDAVE